MNATKTVNGARFGRWTVMDQLDRRHVWCTCECGAARRVKRHGLTTGDSTSCGCLKAQRRAEANYRHGMCGTPTYRSWASMMTRCFNDRYSEWHNYGGRGITVCERWATSFEAFHADMGERPGRDWSIERVENDKGYEPGNCVWATCAEQNRNQRRTRLTIEIVRQLRSGEITAAQAQALTGAVSKTVSDALAGSTWKELS